MKGREVKRMHFGFIVLVLNCILGLLYSYYSLKTTYGFILFVLFLKPTCNYQPHCVGEQFYSKEKEKKGRLRHYRLFYMNYSLKTPYCQSISWDCAIMD